MTSEQRPRFRPEDVETWRREGVALIPNFFTAVEVDAVRADFEKLYGRIAGSEQALDKKKADQVGRFHKTQFQTLDAIPFEGTPALNLIGVHPAQITFAKAALNTDRVHLYQCQAWAKFTGDSDYDQPFHCDFSNHTLTVPSEDVGRNSVTIISYFTDVSDAHGAMHYVTRTDSAKVAGPEASLNIDPDAQASLQAELKQYARSSASTAGTAIPYSIDVYHRGTNLTAPGGCRFAVMACFKKAGDESIGFHAWQFHHTRPWREVFNIATPEQLACFGVQRPGDPFWTDTTLARAQARYPDWDMSAYRAAKTSQ